MATKEKIKEIFDYYEVNSDVDMEFGDWVVSNNADVINVEKAYPIYTRQVQSNEIEYWLEHLGEKTWFNNDEKLNFKDAYERAKEILENPPF